ncbi:hypothetical protein [Halobacillus naozhouensis]|uniref:Uncharacterized protein n=1 Tax=Halobacillus naozhouensis TaxID=554880 RepID=A0ABY8J077_9BACI|nr:hypothetical protein [Halobacillus naozhouensis]WFT74286.1 hypothetical protein P9989_18295 [Halobacillus naozhouensis]
METKEDPRALRLEKMLQEALKPITTKLENLGQEVELIHKEQREIKRMLEEN